MIVRGRHLSGVVARHGCPTDDTHQACDERGAKGKQPGPYPRARPGVPLGGVIGLLDLKRPRFGGRRGLPWIR